MDYIAFIFRMHICLQVDGLESLPKLKELWICQCNVKVISGMENLGNLLKLYLYQNQINKIDNIHHLIHLEVLWLPQVGFIGFRFLLLDELLMNY